MFSNFSRAKHFPNPNFPNPNSPLCDCVILINELTLTVMLISSSLSLTASNYFSAEFRIEQYPKVLTSNHFLHACFEKVLLTCALSSKVSYLELPPCHLEPPKAQCQLSPALASKRYIHQHAHIHWRKHTQWNHVLLQK